MLLVLARHGNTFGPEDTPVWVGASQDLPLTDRGLDQSRAIGDALRRTGRTPGRILAGPLKRTRIGAELAGKACSFSGEIEIDDRLREINYGAWGGKSDAEISGQWGEAAITDWRERSIAPPGAGWTPSPETLRVNARAVFDTITKDRSDRRIVLVMTSNGVLRYFHALLACQDTPIKNAGMKTGHMSAARITADSRTLLAWNTAPEEFITRLRS